MKRIFLTFLTFYLFQSVNAQVISTVGNTFSPDTVVVNIGDTISFVLGSSHNAVEVSESAWLSNSSYWV